jgi:ADP-ribose pyrophosphatase YjhB (NUDIX family)
MLLIQADFTEFVNFAPPDLLFFSIVLLFMQDIHPEVTEVFGNKVRVRVGGILIKDNAILLVNHRGLNASNQFWSPPGGGIQFGESAVESLQREFREETGLEIEVLDFLFVNEYMSRHLQAIELFFEVKAAGSGTLHTGTDPELKQQIISEVKYLTTEQLQQYQASELHQLFTYCKNLADIRRLHGRFVTKIE